MNARSDTTPHRIVIIGGGFAGLYAAVALRRAPVSITLIDRTNYHLFQPLLYQVATASLSPADVAQPIRWFFRKQMNVQVLMAEAAAIDTSLRIVTLIDGELPYDILIVATGAKHSYFGNDAWAAFAPGLKDIPDALEIRRRFLLSFEAAEREPDAAKRRAILTFIIIGGGPTGVELAGAMAEIARRAMPAEFRRIDTTTARVILMEGADRLLTSFDPALSRRARADLESLGVDVWLNTRVTGVDAQGVWIGSERITARSIFWAAGVEASPLGRTLGAPTDRNGRVIVNPDLSIPGHPEVFVIGDLAHVIDAHRGQEVPGVAPAAMQMGRYVARIIKSESQVLQASSPAPGGGGARVREGGGGASRPPFRYTDKGMLATIGRARAVGSLGRFNFAGYPAWLLWLFIHILYLIGFRNRLIVLIQWAWSYFRFERGARLITGNAAHELAQFQPPSPRAP